jgi:hypothetical protein
MKGMTIPPRASQSLAACLGAAQSEAERLYGRGPVPRWQPTVDRRPWIAAGVVAAAAAATTAVWLWGGAVPPHAAPGAASEPIDQVVAIAPRAVVGATTPSEDAAVQEEDTPPAAADCYGAACASGAAAEATSALPALAAAVLPVDMEAWALDPQPLAPPADEPPAALALVNLPDVPDEHDTTPADETPPDDAAFEAPAE